jgi:hypothetical protein
MKILNEGTMNQSRMQVAALKDQLVVNAAANRLGDLHGLLFWVFLVY